MTTFSSVRRIFAELRVTNRKISSGELDFKHPDGVIITMIINFSTLPLKYYSQHHCVRKHQMIQFSALYNCSILPLYGTMDLLKVASPYV